MLTFNTLQQYFILIFQDFSGCVGTLLLVVTLSDSFLQSVISVHPGCPGITAIKHVCGYPHNTRNTTLTNCC